VATAPWLSVVQGLLLLDTAIGSCSVYRRVLGQYVSPVPIYRGGEEREGAVLAPPLPTRFLSYYLPFFGGGGGVGFGAGFGAVGGLFPLPPPDGLPVVLGAFGGRCLLIFLRFYC
jgi:hypothetical protein